MVSKIHECLFVFVFEIEVIECVLEATTNEKFKRKVIDLLACFFVKGSVSIIEALDESVSDRVGNGLVAMGFLEVESGAGEGVLHMIDDAI
jgi:hypothetical protein